LIVTTAGGTEVRVPQVPQGMEERVAAEFQRLLGEEVTVRREKEGKR